MNVKKTIELFKNTQIVKFVIPGIGETKYDTKEFAQIVSILEKQIPIKVANGRYIITEGKVGKCKKCGENISEEDNYCPRCAQKLDWN